MRNIIKPFILIFIILSSSALYAQTADEILAESDRRQVFESSVSSGEIQVRDRFGTKVSTFNAWSNGADETLLEFTSTAERGQKILKTEDSIYLYYPDAEEIIRMQGSALRQSMMGSDISYEDMTGGNDRLSQYETSIIGEETLNGHKCWILSLEAKTRTVPYPKEKIWIDKSNYIVRKGEYSTKSGRLLKEMEVLETIIVGGREIVSSSRISDKMKSDSETIMSISDIRINVDIDQALFSLDELSW